MKLSTLTKRLQSAGIPNARREALMLFEHYLGIPMEKLLFSDPECDSSKLDSALERRISREPLQYILGYAYFYNERYKVTPDCLIPRADTEILVELATRLIPEGESFFDLCCGSGCIAISTLKNTKNTRAYALDISEGAINIARENAIENGVSDRIDFSLADVLAHEDERIAYAVLSNPPYVTNEEYLTLEKELYFEPKNALVGFGEGGCGFYEKIISLYKNRIKKGGFIAFEIGYLQADIVSLMAEKNDMTYEIIKDYSGLNRVLILRNKE